MLISSSLEPTFSRCYISGLSWKIKAVNWVRARWIGHVEMIHHLKISGRLLEMWEKWGKWQFYSNYILYELVWILFYYSVNVKITLWNIFLFFLIQYLFRSIDASCYSPNRRARGPTEKPIRKSYIVSIVTLFFMYSKEYSTSVSKIDKKMKKNAWSLKFEQQKNFIWFKSFHSFHMPSLTSDMYF